MTRSNAFWTARKTNWVANPRNLGEGNTVYLVRRMSCGFAIWEAVINADSRESAIEMAKIARLNA